MLTQIENIARDQNFCVMNDKNDKKATYIDIRTPIIAQHHFSITADDITGEIEMILADKSNTS